MTQPSPTRNPGRLGRYEIIDELGKGAMGVVYLARDPLIGRLVALKTFRVGFSVRDQEMEQFRARFIREAQSAGILSHPGIVTIHDVVEQSEEGIAFIAMEYVRGTNLKMLLQRDGPLDLPLVATIVDQVADALDYAHSRGVVHRDIKPANIILTADSRVKITDFGIARLDTSNLTQEGQLLGTPNYMAPEQILGKDLDHRADIFSLGIVLYEMLTRHKPFQGDNLTVVSHRIVYDHFTPPRQYAEDLPPGVERVLTRALEKEPANRYQRACDLAFDLRQAVRPQPMGDALNETLSLSATDAVPLPELAPPPPLPPPLPPPWRTSWRAALLGRPSWDRMANAAWVAAAACVLVGAVALLSLGWGPAPTPTPQEQARGQVLARLFEGHDLLRSGRYDEALAAYREAERLAPGLPRLRRMRESAEAQASDALELVEQERKVGNQLEHARLALALQRYDEAALAALAVLTVDPDNLEAQQIRDRARESLNKPAQPELRTLPRSGRTGARRPAAVASQPAATEPERDSERSEPAAEVAPAEATLTFSFNSALPKGTLKLMRNGQSIHEEPFNFYKRKSFFRKEAHGGEISRDLKVASGAAELRIYVTPDGKAAKTKTLAVDFPGGSEHRLAIVLDKDGKLSAFFERSGA